LIEISQIAIERNILVLSDELYEHSLFDGKKHVGIGSLNSMKALTISVFTFFKSYAMTGWQVGYAVAPKAFIDEGLNAIGGIPCIPPESTLYAFPNISSFGLTSWGLARFLVTDHKVAVVPESIFVKRGGVYVRISFAADTEKLQEGISRCKKGVGAFRN
jgi:aspartate/methionine/tyrosine aminotransferase